jgi:hypothetical protein
MAVRDWMTYVMLRRHHVNRSTKTSRLLVHYTQVERGRVSNILDDCIKSFCTSHEELDYEVWVYYFLTSRDLSEHLVRGFSHSIGYELLDREKGNKMNTGGNTSHSQGITMSGQYTPEMCRLALRRAEMGLRSLSPKGSDVSRGIFSYRRDECQGTSSSAIKIMTSETDSVRS